MEQKKKVELMYQDPAKIAGYDKKRSVTYGQRWHIGYERDLVLKSIKKIKNKKVKILDVACGTGKFVPELFKNPKNIEYHGLDVSIEMQNILKKKINRKELNLHIGDATKLPFEDNSFDVTYTFHLLWHLEKEDQEKIINEMIRVTKKNGRIIFDSYNRDFIYDKIKNKKAVSKGSEVFKTTLDESKNMIKSKNNLKIFGIFNPHVDSKIIFNLITLIPNKILKNTHFLHHMLYFIVKKSN